MRQESGKEPLQSKVQADFNERLVESIDDTITALLSKGVLDSLHLHLERYFSITKNEVPYCPETFLFILQKTFGPSDETNGKAIAKRFYFKLGLEFDEKTKHNLLEYVEEAKRKLQTMLPNNRLSSI
jgi:hypothetical protein